MLIQFLCPEPGPIVVPNQCHLHPLCSTQVLNQLWSTPNSLQYSAYGQLARRTLLTTAAELQSRIVPCGKLIVSHLEACCLSLDYTALLVLFICLSSMDDYTAAANAQLC